MEHNRWDEFGMDLAEAAAKMSKDPERQVGASILAPNGAVLGIGFNGFPRGIADTSERLNGPDKNLYMAHAERNALDLAGDVRGATLYTTLSPCLDCAKGIIQRGIRRVVYRPNLSGQARKWQDNMAFARALMLEAGIVVDEWDGADYADYAPAEFEP